MNFKKVKVVFQKEFMEVMRDKRTVFTVMVLPVILYPILIIGLNAVMTRQAGVLEEKGATVAVSDSISSASSQAIITDLSQIEHYTIIPAAENAQSLYESKDIQAIISIADSVSASGLHSFKAYIQYDAANERGQLIYSKLRESLKSSEKRLIQEQLEIRSIDTGILSLISITELDTSSSQRRMGMLLGTFLPYIMIMMLLGGASVVAADLVAGEKERKTLETLLVAAIGRKEIVIGKYLTIITMGMLNLIINLFSVSFSLKFMLSNAGINMEGAQMPLKAIFILLAAMLPLATLFSAILLSISTFSRNMKEARSYEQPLLFISIMLGMISFLPAIEMNNLMSLIPVVNIALLFKAVMVEDYQLSHLIITIISTLALDIAAIWGSIRLFNAEGILFRTEDDSGSLKGVKKNKRNFFSPYYGLIYFSIALVALFYLGSYMQSKELYKGLLYTQIFIILLPVVLLLRLLKQDLNSTLRLKAPKALDTLLVIFMAIPGAILAAIIGQLINRVFPFPSQYLENLSQLFKLDIPLWQSFLVIAVAPGICEEILFRGLMPRFFERYGMRMNIIITALLFAAFHLDPFRFVPVFLLGLLLGYQTLKSGSIYLSMLSHTVNNGLAVFIMHFAKAPWMKYLGSSEEIHYWLAAPAVIILSIAIYLFHKHTGGNECVES
ncbi:MAG: ABC transporter permease subunit/CPBP intramembrane protease [Candidatus Cloacimonadaceae bacterium]